MTADRRIDKDQEHSIIGYRCPQSSEALPKRKGPKSTKNEAKLQKTAPSSPPHPASQIQATPSSPPHLVPQTQTDLANVSEQATDPVDLGTSSVVLPEQTVAIPPQGKVPITESLPFVTLGNFQLKIFHR